MSTESNTALMGCTRGRHLSPTQVRPAGEAPDDRWPVCSRALRYKRGSLRGQPILDKTGEAICFCLCRDATGRHRRDHDDELGLGWCLWCREKL